MMNKNRKSIKINAVLNIVRIGINLLFPLITVPYISRVLTVDEIGKYNFSLSIITYALLIAALGIDKFAIREGAKYRDDKEAISEFASKVFSINVVSTIITYLLLFLYLFASRKAANYSSCILILSLEIVFTTIGTEWLYSIFEDYGYITIRSIIFKVIAIILMFVFVRQPGDYLVYTGIYVFSSVGSNIINFIHARKFCKIRLTFKLNWKELMSPILIIFALNIAIKIYVASDSIMLGYLTNDYTVGIYSFSVKIYTIVKNVLAAALTVTIPRLSLYVGKKMLKEYDALIFKLANTLMIMIIPTMVGLIMLSKNIILIIGGAQYTPALRSLRILCIALIFSIFSALFNQGILLPYKKEKKILRSSVISAVTNIGLNFLFIPLLAETGAAITTVIAELTVASMNFYASREVSKKVFFNKHTFRNIITIAIGCAAIIGICLCIMHYVTGIVMQTILSVALSVVVYAGLLIVLKNPIAIGLWNNTKEGVRQRIHR